MKIAHMSDLHFGAATQPDKTDALRRDVSELQPDLVVVSGDVTDRGSVKQFRQAQEFLESLGAPYLCVPGNREICATAFWEWMFPVLAMNRYSRFFGSRDRIVYEIESSDTVLFGVNSVHPLPSWPGKLQRETRYWLREKATAYDGRLKCLVLHHPVLPVVRSSSYWAHTFSDAGDVLTICCQAGIDLILQGHKHRSAVMQVYYPEWSAHVLVSAAGAPLMPRWDSTYHVLECAGDYIIVDVREFVSGAFSSKSTHRFPIRHAAP